ncbi:MAG: alpha/beta fold hydrolase [Gammaproteobacteria bacterium]|nr:alpha/beta fold hydrolase [Gammaproteobacteria bacterium]MDH4315974.1 alpha/beta fold hydrolase [Gammaproteobacteria bacterium]MDH5215209.1 alpha/beta fold hydrolase [Gammaproteobacteria bacterium]MDH5499883.1 alpha/beta fold hydrolase [Gammaproteobacteria bacterium]
MRTNLFLMLLFLAGCATHEPPVGLLGAYAFEDGRTVSIRRSVDDTLRYRVFDSGDSGRLYPTEDGNFVSGAGFSQRDPVEVSVRFVTNDQGVADQLKWSRRDTTALTANRIGREEHIWIDSDGAKLYGRLHLPDGNPPYAAVVLVHGSGDDPGTEWLYNGDFFVANGFAVLAYDKRGSGQSEGDFTFNFEQLADDAGIVARHLADHVEIDADCIGLVGYSQGAWVAPLAASRHDVVKFVIVNYGIIESPAEEARLEMRRLLVDAGIAGDSLESGDELIRAAVDLVANNFESGWPRFLELKKRYRDADWMEHLDGTPVGKLVAYPRWLTMLIGKRQLPPGLDWHYDSSELLLESEIPMAWLLAEDDTSAPNEQTIATLRSLIAQGKPLSLTVFPDADHGMVVLNDDDDETDVVGYAPGYFQAEVGELRRLASK